MQTALLSPRTVSRFKYFKAGSSEAAAIPSVRRVLWCVFDRRGPARPHRL